MTSRPAWYLPVAVVALVWNLLGCAAYLADVMLTTEQVAGMTPDQQALYAARTPLAISATAVAVWFGAAGSLGLVLRKRWATPLLVLSLAGVVVQDVMLFGTAGAAAMAGPVAVALQGLVLVVAVGLVVLARKAAASGWMA